MALPDPGERQASHLFVFNSSTGKWIPALGTTSGIQAIEWTHTQVHAGRFYYASKLWGSGGQVANNANADLLIRCGVESHLIVEVNKSGNCELFVYEDPTITANGTSVTIFNKKRSSSNTSGNSVFHTPTVTGTGTALPSTFLPGGRGGASDGGTSSFTQEMVLAVGKTYLFRVTNRSGVDASISTTLQWYEPAFT